MLRLIFCFLDLVAYVDLSSTAAFTFPVPNHCSTHLHLTKCWITIRSTIFQPSHPVFGLSSCLIEAAIKIENRLISLEARWQLMGDNATLQITQIGRKCGIWKCQERWTNLFGVVYITIPFLCTLVIDMWLPVLHAPCVKVARKTFDTLGSDVIEWSWSRRST